MVEAERAEVDLLLNSRRFARTNNLGRFLSFVCEKYFEGAASEIKEYTIGVEALGRPPEFDPQVDCIVRVTAHNLRRQLEVYYATEGAGRPVQVCLPPGHYVPLFVHNGEPAASRAYSHTRTSRELDTPAPHEGKASSYPASPDAAKLNVGSAGAAAAANFESRKAFLAVVLLSACLLVTMTYLLWIRTSKAKPSLHSGAPTAPLNIAGPEIHALIGEDRGPYVDRAGLSWQSDHFCSGGSSFSVTGHAIQGTEDAQLFSAGRRGIFHCQYPVPSGTYEVHLLFAETSGLQEASRNVAFAINGGALRNLDVVDDAGGDDIATAKITPDVRPEVDGTIHIDFTTPESFANAVEILPATAKHPLPVRIAVRQSPYRDRNGNLWLSDRYFFGGRVSRFGGDLSKIPDSGLYEGHRFGHFRYIIPVASGTTYTLKLYFREQWFGARNRGLGGVGSRVFDVSCNGSTLLKRFDIYGEAESEPLVKSFIHIEPTAQGKIELYFTPVSNYPSISAIEIIPE